MNSFDMVKKAVSNTERSQYKHSEVKQRARYRKPQDRTTDRIEETLRKCGKEGARSPWRRLMQVTGSNVRNEHLVLSAPGCFGVDGASRFSCALEEEGAGCRWSCWMARPGSRDSE
jgi:hypothetical protein